VHHLRAIAYADRFEGEPAFEAVQRAVELCEAEPAPAGAAPCGAAAHSRLGLLAAALQEVSKVDMKKQPYLAKERILKTLHPTFIPKPKAKSEPAAKTTSGAKAEPGAKTEPAQPK